MRVLAFALGAAGLVSGLLSETEKLSQWEKFKLEHKRSYGSTDEHDLRYGIFKRNLDRIEEHNAKKLSWWMGVTVFADMTSDEFMDHITCGNITNPDHNPEKTEALFGSLPVDTNVTVDTTDGVDWVSMGYVTAVKNQGQCGGCWSFATTGAIESRYAITNRQRPIMLSEQELIDCSSSYGNNGCNGGVTDWGFQYVMAQHGLCTENSYPYKAVTQTTSCSALRSRCGAHMDAIRSYADVRRSEANLQNAVNSGPVTVAIEANRDFQLYRGGIFSSTCGTRLNHGVLAVGYGTQNGIQYWKIKNSWGPTWGESGYIRMCKNCGKNGALGQCGICQQASYPVI